MYPMKYKTNDLTGKTWSILYVWSDGVRFWRQVASLYPEHISSVVLSMWLRFSVPRFAQP